LSRSRPTKIDADLPGPCIIVPTNAHVKRYIRRGGNANSGSSQTDVFLVDQAGRVDPETPIIWDFDQITGIVAYPVDDQTLTVTGGRFITIANQAPSKYTYHARGIAVRRSNVAIRGIEHRITGEGDTGAPYGGFLNIAKCANVTVTDALLTGHKTYQTVGSAGRPVSMGSYDILVNTALNVSFINCRQTNDINDRRYWGIMGSNFCKNLVYDGCVLSRFDAHQGVVNATIRDCTLGYMGINAIGQGTLHVENTTVYSRRFINLRPDYGSTWRGEFIIRGGVFEPAAGQPARAVIIGGANDGRHDFGYTCHMPHRVTIDGLHIKDGNAPDDDPGPTVFADFNRNFNNEEYKETFEYIKTREVVVSDLTIDSGKPLRVSDNEAMFKGVVMKLAPDSGH